MVMGKLGKAFLNQLDTTTIYQDPTGSSRNKHSPSTMISNPDNYGHFHVSVGITKNQRVLFG